MTTNTNNNTEAKTPTKNVLQSSKQHTSNFRD